MTAPADEKEMEPETELEDPEAPDDEEDDGEQPKNKMSRKELLPFVAIGLVGFIIIVGPIAYFMGWVHAALGIEQAESTALVSLGKPVNFELPQIKADLKTGQCRSPFLRAQFIVQLSSDDVERIEDTQDKVVEQVILHLRDQERQDLVGKARSGWQRRCGQTAV